MDDERLQAESKLSQVERLVGEVLALPLDLDWRDATRLDRMLRDSRKVRRELAKRVAATA